MQVRNGIGEPDAALSVLGEFPGCAQQLGNAGGEGEALALQEGVRAILPVALHELGLVIVEVEVRR